MFLSCGQLGVGVQMHSRSALIAVAQTHVLIVCCFNTLLSTPNTAAAALIAPF